MLSRNLAFTSTKTTTAVSLIPDFKDTDLEAIDFTSTWKRSSYRTEDYGIQTDKINLEDAQNQSFKVKNQEVSQFE